MVILNGEIPPNDPGRCVHSSITHLYGASFAGAFLLEFKAVNELLAFDRVASLILHFGFTKGLAIGIGFSAGTNLDQVLLKLDQVSKTDMTKKSSGILSFMKVRPRFLNVI